MQSLKSLSLIFLTAVVQLTGCSKSQDTTIPAKRFTWIYKNIPHTASQFSAFQYSRGQFVIIGAQGNTFESFPRCYFSLNSFSKGAHPVNATGINVFKYYDEAGNELEAATGEVNITAYSSDEMSVNFSAMMQSSSGSTTPVSGTFSSIPVVP